MISQNDLYDMTFALSTIRNNISDETNKTILNKIVCVLNDNNNFEDNQIRKAISSIKELNSEKWSIVYHNNTYVKHQFLKDKEINDLLIKLCKELIRILETKNFERAYDLSDSFHCLPNIIADNNFRIPKSFWKTYIKDYSNKWDKCFLKRIKG